MKRAKKYLRNDQFIKKLGLRIRSLRQESGLTIKELAEDCGIEYIQLSRIERGKINTSVSHVDVIAQSLNVHCRDLFDWD